MAPNTSETASPFATRPISPRANTPLLHFCDEATVLGMVCSTKTGVKPKLALLLLAACLALASGCASYAYRIVEPPSLARQIADEPVTVNYAPLQYRFSRYHNRLGMDIINPTDDRMTLRGDQSYVVDPTGQSRPVRGGVIASHSFSAMLWPPNPVSGTAVYPDYYAPGWWGYPYGWGPYYGGFYYGPAVSYFEVRTPFDWNWDVGPARFHFTYYRNGQQFSHDFVILRERER